MRLAVYTDYAYHRHDGEVYAERAFAVFIAGLARHVDALIVPGRLDPSASRSRYALGPGVTFAPLPYYRTLARPLSASLAMARSLGRLWRVLDEVDCVWLLGPHPLALAFAALAALRGRQVVLGVRQDYPSYVRSRHPGRRLIWLAAFVLDRSWAAVGRIVPVVVVGPALAERYRRSKRVLEIAVSTVRADDVVSAELAAKRPYDGPLTALSVGRLDAEKNPLLLADVLARLRERDPRWRLVVCGEGPLEAELRRRLRRLGLAEHAELRGYVPLDRGLRDVYRSSHALLHVSWTEGLPQVLFEAFAAGLPVVATDVGGVTAVRDAVRLVAPGDAEAAAAELSRVATDSALRALLVDAGRALALERTLERESRRVAYFLSALRS